MITVHPSVSSVPGQTDAESTTTRADVTRVGVPWEQLSPAGIEQRGPHTPGARIHLEVDVPPDATSGWPGGEQVDGLLGAGVTEVHLRHAGAVTRAASVHLVGFLGEAMSRGLPVVWDLEALGGSPGRVLDAELWPFELEAEDLVHLPPPTGSGPVARTWRDRHAYGLLYWRNGCTFAAVMDLRDIDPARYTLDDPELLGLFADLGAPRRVEQLVGGEQGPLRVLREARLAYVADGWAVRLPYRLLRWPTPLDPLG